MNQGDRVADRINGFEGIVIGRAEYFYGCKQVLVAPEKLDDKGKRQDAEWMDEDRVRVVTAVEHPESAPARAGGPLTNPAPPTR